MLLRFKTLTNALLALFFPDRCVGCNQYGSLFCAQCQAKLKPYPAHANNDLPTAIEGATVAFVYGGPLRDAIHEMKYRPIRRMAEPLGDLLARHLATHPQPADAIVAVPLHPKRMAERGFNQAELLADRLATRLQLPLLRHGLERCRDTPHQVGLDHAGRQANVHAAFIWRSSVPPPAQVLIVDDVLTTGATIAACAEALQHAGTRAVRAVALARSRG